MQVSAETGEGIEDLIAEIAHRFAGRFERVELLVPHERGEVLGELYALGSPIEREEEAEGVRVRAHLPRGDRRALRRVPRARAGARRRRRRRPVIELPVVLGHPDARLPARAHADDAGLDLRSVEDVEIPPGERGACARACASRSRPGTPASCCRARASPCARG